MIQIKNLNFSYNEKSELHNLKNINLEINDGECVLFCGASGSGKTSITKVINSLIPNYYDGKLEGEVLIDGNNTATQEIYEVSRFVGSVFQNPKSQFFNINTTAEILFYLENRGIDRSVMHERLQEVSKAFNIQHLLDKDIFKLSGGEKQMIAIASAYASGTKIIVLDEPSSNLDNYATEILGKMLKTLKDDNRTIIISEHRFYFIKDIIDTVYYLKEGEIKNKYTSEKFFTITDDERKKLGLRSIQFEELNGKIKTDTENTNNSKTLCINSFAYYFREKDYELAFKDKSFNYGSIVGIYGKNGIGKSTFIRSLMGLEKKDYTKITLNGKTLSKKQRLKMSYLVMQDVNYQLFTDSVENEVSLGMHKKYTTADLNNVLTELNIHDLKDFHPMALSGGQKQRVALASALLSGSEIICFDEPTSGMDYANMMRISKLIKTFSTPDNIIFIISHDNEFLNNTTTEIFDLTKYYFKVEEEI